MISGIDHIVVLCPSIDAGEAAYSAVLGRSPDWRSRDDGGSASVMFQLSNMALELMAPSGGGPLSRRLHALLDAQGPGPQSMVLATPDIEEGRRALDRRGMRVEEISSGESLDIDTRRMRSWKRFRIDDSSMYGVRAFVLQRRPGDPLTPKPVTGDVISALDHVVIHTAEPDRAAATYGARLGFRLALDRTFPDWGMRLMFFRLGDVTVELAQRLSGSPEGQADRLWGLSWKVADIEAARARMQRAGLSVSDIRAGRRAGTRVFTVKDGTLNVPTLVLSEDTAAGSAG